MKKFLLFLSFISACVTKAQDLNPNIVPSQTLLLRPPVTYYLQSAGIQTLSCPPTYSLYYDSGGPGSNYSNSENSMKTFSAPTGSCVSFNFSAFNTESCCDFLRVYDGPSGASPLLGSFSGAVGPGNVVSSGSSMTFSFTSDGSVVAPGWTTAITCTTCPPPPAYYVQGNGSQTLSCPPTYTLFYDSGGPAFNYNNSEDLTKTFSTTAGSCLSFSFTGFNTESCCDFLRIYDGPTVGAPLIGTYSGVSNPGLIISTGSAITYSFHSDGSVSSNGWSSEISCVPSCAGAPAAGTAIASPSSACTGFSTTLSVTGVPAACGLTFQWQSSAAPGGPYANIAGATAPTYTGNVAATTYFQRLTMCGAFTATSAVASASIGCPYYIQAAGIETIICPPTYTLFYDSGGPAGNYNNSENSMKTFSAPAGSCLTFNFNGFNTESCCDFLRIYDGPNGGAPLIGTYSGGSSPGSITSSGSALTFSFNSDGSVVSSGWGADISCGGSCVGTPPGGTTSAVPSTSCAPFNTTLSVSGSTTGCGLSYQWQSAAAPGGPYSNIAGAVAAGYTANVAVDTYFRRLTSCGVNTSTSGVAGATISTPSVVCSLSTYNAAVTTYSFESFVGTLLPSTDDVLFNGLSAFGFPFCFAGQQFNGGYVASNSAFVFDAFPCYPNIFAMPGAVNAAPGIGTGWSINQPAPTNTDNTPRNAILAPWHDSDPGVGGIMRYTTLGVAPTRRFIVSWENVPMFSCNALLFSAQIKLFETSGVIEIHIQNKPVCATWNAGQAIMGLHNYDGTIYRPPVNATAHNAPIQWTMTNTAYQWTSTCPSVSSCAVPLPIGFKNLYGQQIDGINKLWWETSEENAITEFLVERSTDAVNFKQIGTANPLNKPSTHLYNDNTFERGFINYYKVTAVDKAGKHTSTSIYPIFNTDDKILVTSVFPNPASDKLSVNVVGRGASANCSFTIFDQFGRIVVQKNQKIGMGSVQVDIDIEALVKGVYVIKISTDDNSVISKQKFTKM